MIKTFLRATAVFIPAFALIVPASRAVVVFSDTFEAYTAALNQTNFGSNWTVSGGSVDVVNNFAGIPTKTVDLDGSSSNAGILTSALLSLTAGDYALTYWLAGSQRGDSNTVDVFMSGIAGATQSHTLPSVQGLTLFTLNFTLAGPTNSSIVFDHAGGDNLGLLLDNVVLERRDVAGVPDHGATLALIGTAFALLGFLRRRLND
jgi:hypothetical protein